jgi:hypothetical protein
VCLYRAKRLREEQKPQPSCAWNQAAFALFCSSGYYVGPDSRFAAPPSQ